MNEELNSLSHTDTKKNRDCYYIAFKNIECSEYLGAIDPEVEASQGNVPLPQEIQGVMYENEITIQNYGNAMKYYVKPGDCDVKYIYLTREVKLAK